MNNYSLLLYVRRSKVTDLKNKPASKSFEDLIGLEFTGVKGQDAIEKLLEEKQGHVKEAFYREEIGWIDIFWGDKTAGLCHIIAGRNKRGTNGRKFAIELGDVIKNGIEFAGKDVNRFNIAYKGKVAVIAFELRGVETTALLTAFLTKK